MRKNDVNVPEEILWGKKLTSEEVFEKTEKIIKQMIFYYSFTKSEAKKFIDDFENGNTDKYRKTIELSK